MRNESTYKNIDGLIADYFARELSNDDLERLQAWIKLSPENDKYFQQMQDIWFSSLSADKAKQYCGEDAYTRFLKRTLSHKGLPVLKKRSFHRAWWYVAAAVALLFIVSYASYQQGGKQVTSRFAEVVIEAPLGSKTKMSLPDGSLVWLNCGSKLVYSQGFGVNDRELYLSGEGYFEVVKNRELAFTVKTDGLQVDVLGTKFNFRNYPDDQEATVSLVEGKVLVSNSEDNIHLVPNLKVFFNKSDGKLRVIELNAKYTTEWTKGYLFFDEELLTDIIKELERNYNVEIILEDNSLESFRFYGNFIVREQSIEDVMQTLAGTNKIKYTIEDRKIFLSAGK